MTYEPGWRWSTDVKPIAGTPTCQYHHVGITLEGQLRVQMPDGTELELGPGDVFDIPPGHDAWVVGDNPWVSVDFEAMRTYGREADQRDERVLASILFTDIVESTEIAGGLGAARWRELLAQHNELAERAVDRYRGVLVKTTGDGILARFESAEGAVRAGVAARDVLKTVDLEIRAGIHAGEVSLAAGDIRGLPVHLAARIMALGGPGEILVSSTVRDLLDGTSLAFEDRGTHELKGIPGARTVYAVRS